MKCITVFDRYYPKNVQGFTKPFKALVVGALEDLGYTVNYIDSYDSLSVIRDSLVLCVIAPELMINNYHCIDSSNYVIWWNLEPFDITGDSADSKLAARRTILDSVTRDKSKYNLDKVVFFNKKQAELYNSEQDFLPIGYHSVLSCDGRYDKKRLTILFAGYRSSARNVFLNKVNEGLSGAIVHAGHSASCSLESNIQGIYRHKFGLDCPSKWTEKHIHWHRIVMYAANKAVLLSSSDLSEYGIIDNKHYIRYSGERNLIKKAKRALKLDRGVIRDMAEAMLSKIQKDFMMADLFEKLLDDK